MMSNLQRSIKSTEQIDPNQENTNLWNLSGFATTRFANYDGGRMSLHQVEKGGPVPVHWKPLPLLLDTSKPISRHKQAKQPKNYRPTLFVFQLCSANQQIPNMLGDSKRKLREETYPEEDEEAEAERKRTPPSSSSISRGFSVPGFQNCDISLLLFFSFDRLQWGFVGRTALSRFSVPMEWCRSDTGM